MRKTTKLLTAVMALIFMSAGPALASDYPTQVNKRPLTLPSGAYSAGAVITAANSFDAIGLTLGGSYAVNDTLQVNAGYGLSLSPFEVGKGLAVGANYGVINDGALRLAPSVTLPLNFGDGDTLPTINIGADARYNLMDDKLALFFGHGLLVVGVSEFLPSYMINIPVGAGYQVNDNVHVRLDLRLFSLFDGGSTSIADTTPLTLTGMYSPSNKLDVGLAVSMDAQAAGDTLGVNLMAAYRGF